jgi:hypothetical protein
MAAPRHPLPIALALAVLLVTMVLSAGVAEAATSPVSVYGPMVSLRPEQPAPAGAGRSATLSAARNETTAFQLLIEGGPAGQSGVNVTLADALTGPEGATIPTSDVTIYREDNYEVKVPSDLEGGTGKWPDALIPARDPLFNEQRTAFPVSIPVNGKLGVWVDVLVPLGQAPGSYAGALVVTAGGTTTTVPVSLAVSNLSLSSTSSFKSAFHADPWQICSAFTGQASCGGNQQLWWELEAEFAEIGLDNRITISNPYATDGYSPPRTTAQRNYFAQYIVPLLQGTDPRVRLPGAKLTSFDTYENCVIESTTCLGEWKSLAAQYGFSERFFLYDCDEPSTTGDWNYCAENARLAEKSWPGVRRLITANSQSLQEHGAVSYTNIATPTVNDMISNNIDRRTSYNTLLQNSSQNELWTYTSCMSYGCDESLSPYGNGWPGYAIDEPPVQAAAIGWLGFGYQLSGELYYNTTRAIATATSNQYYSGGNGDGNLFYAGTPAGGHGSIAVGGTHPIPIESLRMKRIREGYQAYEYLHMLEERGQRGQAMSIFEGLFGPLSHAMNNVTFGAAAMEGAKEQLGELLGAASRSPEGPPAPVEVGPTESPTEAPAVEEPAGEEPSASQEPTPPTAHRSHASPPTRAGSNTQTTTGTPTSGGQAGTVSSESGSGKLQVRVLEVKVPPSTSALVHRGIRTLVRCSTTCRVAVGSQVRKAVARKLQLGGTEVGRGVAILKAGQKRWVTVRPTARAHPLSRHTRSTAGLGIRATVTATGIRGGSTAAAAGV